MRAQSTIQTVVLGNTQSALRINKMVPEDFIGIKWKIAPNIPVSFSSLPVLSAGKKWLYK